MPPIRGANTAVFYAAGSGGLTVARPTGAVAGDVLAVVVATDGTANQLTAPTGWVRWGTLHRQGGATDYGYFTLDLTAAHDGVTSWAFTDATCTASANHCVAVTQTRGTSTGTSQSGTTDVNGVFPCPSSLSTPEADCMVLLWGSVYATVTFTPPAGFAEWLDEDSISVADDIQASAGNIGTNSFDSTGTNAPYTSAAIILLPLAASTTVTWLPQHGGGGQGPHRNLNL